MKYKLGELFDLQMGKTPDRKNFDYWNNGTQDWIAISDLGKCGKYIVETKEKITELAVKNSNIKKIDPNTVVMSFKLSIGKVAITKKEMYSNEAIMAFHDKKIIEIDPNYLYYLLMGQNWDEGTNKAVMGKTLNKATLSNKKISIHSLVEQKQIIKVLDVVNNLISVQKKQIELYDKLIKSRFVEMFGVPTKNEKGFELLTVGDVVDFQGGSQPDKKFFEYEKTADNIRLIQIRDYKTDAYITYIPKSMAKRFCEVDDIMIGRYGPPIFQILKGIEGSYNVALMKAIPKKGNKEFIRHFLQQDCLLEYLEGLSQRTAGQAGIDMPMLKAYPLPYPPIDMQEMFAAFAKEVDNLKSTAHQSLKKLQTLQKSLMQQYFT